MKLLFLQNIKCLSKTCIYCFKASGTIDHFIHNIVRLFSPVLIDGIVCFFFQASKIPPINEHSTASNISFEKGGEFNVSYTVISNA